MVHRRAADRRHRADGLSTAIAERLRKAEDERDALKRARTRAAVAPLPSAIRTQVQALVTGLDVALRTDVGRALDALRAVLGNVIEDIGAVYAECDNAAERLLLAVGGVSMGRVAGGCNLTCLRIGEDRTPVGVALSSQRYEVF